MRVQFAGVTFLKAFSGSFSDYWIGQVLMYLKRFYCYFAAHTSKHKETVALSAYARNKCAHDILMDYVHNFI